jgi:hypothetical protein
MKEVTSTLTCITRHEHLTYTHWNIINKGMLHMFQGDVADVSKHIPYIHVSHVALVCFICFTSMFHVSCSYMNKWCLGSCNASAHNASLTPEVLHLQSLTEPKVALFLRLASSESQRAWQSPLRGKGTWQNFGELVPPVKQVKAGAFHSSSYAMTCARSWQTSLAPPRDAR